MQLRLSRDKIDVSGLVCLFMFTGGWRTLGVNIDRVGARGGGWVALSDVRHGFR